MILLCRYITWLPCLQPWTVHRPADKKGGSPTKRYTTILSGGSSTTLW